MVQIGNRFACIAASLCLAGVVVGGRAGGDTWFGASAVKPAASQVEAERTPVANAAVVTADAGIAGIAAIPHQRVTRANDGLFYLNAVVNGRPMRFLVDTGASIVVLTERDARAVGIDMAAHRFNANVDTVNGAAPMAWTTIDRVQIGRRNIDQIKAAIVREGLGVSLLGQNALSQLGAITIDGDELVLH